MGNKAWGKVTSTYNSAGTRQTSLAARRLINLASKIKPLDETSQILDLGAGAGAMTIEAARASPSSKILATDVSENMVDFVAKLEIPNVSTKVLDAADVGSLGNGVLTHVLSTFMLQFMVQPDAAVEGAYKVLESGGVVGLGLWYLDSDFIVPWEKACRTVDPAYRVRSYFVDPDAWTTPEVLKKHMETAGFVDVETSSMYVPFDFPSAEAFTEFVCKGGVPSVAHITLQWTGDMYSVEEALTKIVREEYGDGKDLRLHAFLGVGRKP